MVQLPWESGWRIRGVGVEVLGRPEAVVEEVMMESDPEHEGEMRRSGLSLGKRGNLGSLGQSGRPMALWPPSIQRRTQNSVETP